MFGWKRNRLSKRKSIILIVVALFATSAYVLGWSSLLTVKEVMVIGAPTNVDKNLIAKSVKVGERLARIDTRYVVGTLRNYSWLKEAEVNRDWFHGLITIKVKARQPLAIVGNEFVDSEGVIFSLPHIERFSVPLILANSQESISFAAELLWSLPKSFRKNVEVISIEGLQTATFLVKKNEDRTKELSVRWGDASNILLKMRVYHSLLQLPENSRIVFMDLSAPHAPIVR